jgi:hypothetical protein
MANHFGAAAAIGLNDQQLFSTSNTRIVTHSEHPIQLI